MASRTTKGDSSGSAKFAYDRIRQAIVEGWYKPGQRLVEQRVGEEFDLSRTPVREALHLLEAEGLVISIHNRGAMVRPVSDDDILELYELRAHLESLAAIRAATRATSQDIEDMDFAIREFGKAISPASQQDLDHLRALNLANNRFHQAVFTAARQSRLSVLFSHTVDIPLVFQAFRRFNRDELDRSHLFHQLIRDAIAKNEPERAGNLISEHIYQGRDTLLSQYYEESSVNSLPEDDSTKASMSD